MYAKASLYKINKKDARKICTLISQYDVSETDCHKYLLEARFSRPDDVYLNACISLSKIKPNSQKLIYNCFDTTFTADGKGSGYKGQLKALELCHILDFYESGVIYSEKCERVLYDLPVRISAFDALSSVCESSLYFKNKSIADYGFAIRCYKDARRLLRSR